MIFLKTDRDSEAIVRYVVMAIASEYPSHHIGEAGSRLSTKQLTCTLLHRATPYATITLGRNNDELSQTHSSGSGMDGWTYEGGNLVAPVTAWFGAMFSASISDGTIFLSEYGLLQSHLQSCGWIPILAILPHTVDRIRVFWTQ